MSIYRGTGSASTTTDQATIDEVTTQATNAANSATAAASSASSAASSASSASSSASTATSQASAASTSASNASSSATSASNSATASANSATAAAASATTAASEATNAETAKDAAELAQSGAVDAKNAAVVAQNAAETAETNVNATINAAVATATADAQAAQTAAETAETNAAASASAASTSASNAATSATNAETNANNASTSASQSATSATQAAASAASAASALDNFDDRYLGAKSADPALDNDGDALITGALYFNTTDGVMRIYTASGWIDASSSSVATMQKYKFTATSGQTVFSGSDDDAETLSLTVGAEMVTLNGVVLEAGTDYTVTSSSITLASGATTSDELNVYAFGNFLVADTVSASTGGTFQAEVTFDGGLVSTTGDFNTSLNVDGTITADGLTVDTTTLVVDSANNRVGIGTDSPSAKLELSSDDVELRLTDTSGGYSDIRYAAGVLQLRADQGNNVGASSMRFSVDSTEAMRIDSDGDISFRDTSANEAFYWDASEARLGLGTGSSPSTYLEVIGDGSANNALTRIKGGTAAGTRGIEFANDSSGNVLIQAIRSSDNATGYQLTLNPSGGNVGIGVTPSSWGSAGATGLQVGTSLALGYSNATGSFIGGNSYYSASGWKRVASGAATAYLLGGDGSHTWYSTSTSSTADSAITFSQPMTLDASGNLLVGKTTSDFGATVGFELNNIDKFYVTRSGASTAAFNRLSTDGEIVGFAKDGATVGAIGNTAYLDELSIYTSGKSGLTFSTSSIVPTSGTGSYVDNSKDLGTSNYRFKDLYLSGGVYVGGTGAANHLDDYEEGNWTPAVTGETGFGFGAGTTGTTVSYTKIGRMFYTTFKIRSNTITDGTQTFELTGWPFAPSSVGINGLKVRPTSNQGTKVPSGYEDVVLTMNDSSTTATIRAVNKGTTNVDWSGNLDVDEVFAAGGWQLSFTVWYEVA